MFKQNDTFLARLLCMFFLGIFSLGFTQDADQMDLETGESSLVPQTPQRTWGMYNSELSQYWKEFVAAKRSNNTFFQKNRLDKIQALIDSHGIQKSPILSHALLKLSKKTNDPHLLNLAHQFSPESSEILFQECSSAYGFQNAINCFKALVLQSKEAVHQFWVPSQLALRFFQAFIIASICMLLAFYIRDMAFIPKRWFLIFPGISPLSAYAWETFCLVMSYLIGGIFGFASLIWFFSFLHLSQRELRFAQKVAFTTLLMSALLLIPASYHSVFKKWDIYLDPLAGMHSKNNIAKLDFNSHQLELKDYASQFNLAYQSIFLDTPEFAFQKHQDALEKFPESEKLQLNWILLDYLRGNRELALSNLKDFTQKNRDFGLAHFNLGKLYFLSTNIEEASRHHDQSKRINEKKFFDWEKQSQKKTPRSPFVFSNLESSDLQNPFIPKDLFSKAHQILKEHHPSFGGALFWLCYLLVLLSSLAMYSRAAEERTVTNYKQKDTLSFQEILEHSENPFEKFHKKISFVFPGFFSFRSARFSRALMVWLTLGLTSAPYIYKNLAIPNPALNSDIALWPISMISILILALLFLINFFYRLAEQ